MTDPSQPLVHQIGFDVREIADLRRARDEARAEAVMWRERWERERNRIDRALEALNAR